MFRTKKDVDKHVTDILQKIKNENERSLRGYTFAKMYFIVQEYECAKRYLAGFLSLKERDAAAHKLMGQIYEKTKYLERALQSYKRSLELQENQKDVVLKICELYCETPIDPERARYWADRAEILFPNHETVFRLRECIVTADGEQNSQELEDLIAAELAKRPRDVSLRVKLIKLYLDAERSDEAYQHAVSVESKRPYIDSLDWYYCLTDTFEVYSEECGRDLMSEFYVNALNALDRLVYLSLEEKLNKNKFISQINHVTSIADCAAAMHSFDQTLYKAWQLPEPHEGFWGEYLNHMRGQLFFHIGTLILKKAKKDQVHSNMKEACRMASALFLAAYTFKPPDLHSAWFVQANETRKKEFTLLYTEACFRLSQTGHVIIGLCKEDRCKWLQKVRQQICTPQGKEKIFQKIFSTRDSQTLITSYIMEDVTLVEFSPEFPDPKTLQDYDDAAHLLYPDSLHHVVWLALQYYTTKQKVQPDYKFQIFSGLQFSVNNLNSASPESLCQLDVDAFLNATVQTAALCLEEKNSIVYSGQEAPSFFPACISTLLCTNEQSDWWTAAYLLFKNLAKEKLGDLRRTLQRGIEVVRVLGAHGMDVNLIVHLSETFAERARDLKEQNENATWRHLESRAALYWRSAIAMLERLNKNQTCVMPKERLFDCHHRDLSTDEVKKLLDDGRFFLACQAMNANKNEEAIEAFDDLKSAYASYYQALIYKKLAADECNQPRELITSEMRSKHIILLTRARDALYVTLDRLQGNRKHPLNQVLSYEIEDIETKLARIDPDMAQRHDFDGLSDECLSSQDSDEPEVESSHQEPHNITGKSSTPHVTLSLRHDSPDQQTSRHREEHTRPSPERLDAQLRFLTHAHETVLKTFVDQNKAVMESSKHIVEELKKINTRLEEIQKQVIVNKTRSRLTRVRGGMSNRGGVVRPPPQQIPEPVAQPPREEEEENDEDFYDGYYYEDEDYQDPNDDAAYQDYSYNKFNEPSHNEYPYGHVTGLHGTSTVTYAPPQNNGRSLLGQPATGYPGYYPPSTATPITPQGPLPPGYFGASGHTISAGLPFTEGQKLPEFNFNPSLLPLQNNTTPAVKDAVFSRLGNGQQSAEDANATAKNFVPRANTSSGSNNSTDGKSSTVPHAFQITMPATPTLTVTSPFQGSELASSESPSEILPKSVDRSTSEDQEDESVVSDFKPLIPLPDEVEVRTGEEEERVLFEERAKLFRFVGKEWKERGIGIVKILANEKTGKCRILMRRDQIWKICANHFVTSDMSLAPLKNLELAWVWAAQDFADETMKTERFCIRFKTKEIADNFKTEFDKAKVMGTTVSLEAINAPAEPSGVKTNVKSPEMPVVGFGDRFKPKSGTWECQTCFVYNPPDRNTCLACETSKDGAIVQSSSDLSKFGMTANTPSTTNANSEPVFKFGFPSIKDKGASDILTSTPIPPMSVFGSPAVTASVSAPSTAFTFQRDSGDFDKSKQTFVFGSPQTISPNKLGGGFVFGASAVKNSSSLLPVPETSKTTSTTSSAATITYGGFTFTSSPTIKADVEGKGDAKDKTNPTVSKTVKSKPEKGDVVTEASTPRRSPFQGFSFSPMKPEIPKVELAPAIDVTPEKADKTKLEGKNLFAILTEGKTEEDKSKSGKTELLFSELATADSSAFKKDPNFQGFTGVGQSVFGAKSNESTEETEYEPQINFDPVIPMPELVEVKTGEEDDDKLFGERARLYRFDATLGQWKERGIGEMKILKNRVSGMCRVLMRREQIYKVCANHRIEAFMQLASHAMSEKLWTWAAYDFSEDLGVAETFAVRFKTQEQANIFRDVFERCVKDMQSRQAEEGSTTTNAPTQNKDKDAKTESNEEKKDTPLVPLSELFKPKAGSWECKICYVRSDEDQTKCVACETPRYESDSKVTQDTTDSAAKTNVEGPKFLFGMKTGGGGGEGFKFGASPNTTDKLPTTGFKFGSPSNFTFGKTEEIAITEKEKSDIDVGFRFGSPQAFTFSFSGVRPKSPNKTPKSPHHLDKSVESPGEVDESTTEDEADQIYFQPVIPLPERVEIKTGEEDEEVMYCQRAKLFRLVDGEWKERGLGDIKILRHKNSNNVRLLMRREQIHKVCLNHYLTRRLKFVAKDDKSWMWGTTDFAENEPCKETFTVRFKNSEIAKNFKDAVEKAKEVLSADESDGSMTADSSSNTSVLTEKDDGSEKVTTTTPATDPTTTFSFRMETISQGGTFSFGNKFGNTHGSATSTSSVFGGTPTIFGSVKPRDDVDDLKIVCVKETSAENREKARKLMLPDNFYLYEDKPPCPGCRGCDDEKWSFSDNACRKEEIDQEQSSLADLEIVEEPKAEPDRVKQALDLGLPPNFYLYEKKPPCPGCRGCEKETKPENIGDEREKEKVAETEKQDIDKPMFEHDPGIDFAAIAEKATEKPTFAFSPSFAFDRIGEKVFRNRKNFAHDDDDEDGDASSSQSPQQKDIHFDPVVPLPDLVELKTGEEDEDKIYSQRAKLYRFDSVKKEWKERGVGDAKILKHRETNRFRLILRREQIHKIACNHYITSDMVLNPLFTSETAWCWFAMDFAEENPTVEQFAIRFKTTELAKEFKRVFEECKRNSAELQKNSKGMEDSNLSHSSDVEKPHVSSETETDNNQQVPSNAPDESYEEDEEGDDDDEEEDDDDGDSVMFERRVSLAAKDTLRGQFNAAVMGNLRVLYDDDFYGARVQVVSDDATLMCNHLIAMQTILNVDGKNCFWAAEDYSGDAAVYRYFQAIFSSAAAAKDFESTFNEGKEYAKHSDIWERPFNPAGGDNVSDNGTATPTNAIKTCSPEISAALEEIIRGSQ